MIEVYRNLYVGSDIDCSIASNSEYAIIHACKFPCHRRVLGYKSSLPPSHPHYLIYEDDSDLYLNLVDMDRILSRFADPIFFKAMEFIKIHIEKKKLLVHCNQGISRSPAIALVYMAKNKIISNDSYSSATSEFKQLYPKYNPGAGISIYVNTNWKRLVKLK